ncbi:unnamed protein product [Sphagnum jensenii]
MDPALQEVLTDLQLVMKEAEPYMDSVLEWFASNYQLYKENKRAATDIIQDSEDFSEEAIRKQTEAARMTANFQKRAGIKKTLDTKNILEQIKGGGGAADPSEFVGVDDDGSVVDMSEEDHTPLSPREASQMISSIGGNDEEVVKNYYEMQKLRRAQFGSNNTPKVNRSE